MKKSQGKSRSTHPDEEYLVSESVAALREILDGHFLGTVTGGVITHIVVLQERRERGWGGVGKGKALK